MDCVKEFLNKLPQEETLLIYYREYRMNSPIFVFAF